MLSIFSGSASLELVMLYIYLIIGETSVDLMGLEIQAFHDLEGFKSILNHIDLHKIDENTESSSGSSS